MEQLMEQLSYLLLEKYESQTEMGYVISIHDNKNKLEMEHLNSVQKNKY